jgi:hypothetical protein
VHSPGGFILINSGPIQAAGGNQAGLEFAMAHEMAHGVGM